MYKFHEIVTEISNEIFCEILSMRKFHVSRSERVNIWGKNRPTPVNAPPWHRPIQPSAATWIPPSADGSSTSWDRHTVHSAVNGVFFLS